MMADDRLLKSAIVGCLLGGAAGDAMGLPREGLSPARARKFFGNPDRHRLLPGKGMISDDTEHACFVAAALIRSDGDPQQFERYLARSLRYWLLSLTPTLGMATLIACLKLCLGFSSKHSGVDSAGNGAAMRSAILGVVWGDDRDQLRDYVRRSTYITHRNDRAYQGALVVAVAAHISATENQISGHLLLSRLRHVLDGKDSYHFISLIEEAVDSAKTKERVSNLALRLGCHRGISGYVEHTVPCVIQVWLRYPGDFEKALQEIISAGGDTDTTAAILGGIMGAGVGKNAIPKSWLAGIVDWPRGVVWIERLGIQLARAKSTGKRQSVPSYLWPLLPLRNLFLLLLVLLHGFRRLLPPY
ncbi:MAG: ADP-ribosylglycohydrolase family protein [Motiliproteus sp.]